MVAPLDAEKSPTHHITVNETEYACIVKPVKNAVDIQRHDTKKANDSVCAHDAHHESLPQGRKDKVSSGNESEATNLEAGQEGECVYSLADPVDNDLVVVENDLYGTR